MMLLSVIVPVYNAEKYITDCLDSLLSQGITEDDYEIICVNDGSIDGTTSIIESYIADHESIRLIDQANTGVSAARNKGIEVSQGEYCTFVDSDDYLEPNSYGRLLRLMNSNNAESCYFGFDEVKDSSHFEYSEYEYSPLTVLHTGGKHPYTGNIWRFIFPTELLKTHAITFNEKMNYAEDELFIFKVLCVLDLRNHLYIQDKLYHYRNNPSSLTHCDRIKRLESHKSSMLVMAEEYDRLIKEGKVTYEIEKDAVKRKQYAISNYMMDGLLLKASPDEVINQLVKLQLYPFGINPDMLKFRRPIKNMFINYLKAFFTFKWYYKLLFALIRILH